jgi:hypothetical protein
LPRLGVEYHNNDPKLPSLQAAICDRLSFDPFAFEEDTLAAPKVDVGPG